MPTSKTKSHLSPVRGRRHSSISESSTSSSGSSGDVFETAPNKKYRLKVTAGKAYDMATHQCVPVNEDHTVRIDSELATVSLGVRVQDYNGMFLSYSIYRQAHTHTEKREIEKTLTKQ